jgi:hypothetical protein
MIFRKPSGLTEQEAFEQGFHGIPDPAARAKMSPEKLAILLSECKPESPAYILVEHELNLRLAKEQSGATWKAAGLGFLGALLAALLGAWGTGAFQPPQTQTCVCSSRYDQPAAQATLSSRPAIVVTPQAASKPFAPASSSAASLSAQASQSAGSKKP